MNLPPVLLQFFISLLAIFALAGLAWWMKLGSAPTLETEEDARRAADDAVSGFVPVRFEPDFLEQGALIEDENGRILLLKRHGSQLAGRLLGPDTRCFNIGGLLTIDCGERRFGEVTFDLVDAGYWEAAINKLKKSSNA